MALDENALFIYDPLRDLDTLLEEARDRGASRLLILAGKAVVCRIAGKLSPPMRPGNLHFRQTESLVHALLNENQQAELDKSGAVEIDYKTPPGNNSEKPPVKMNIFFGDGAHNAVVFLTEKR